MALRLTGTFQQSAYLEWGNHSSVTHILHFESLQVEFEALMQQYGLTNIVLLRANVGSAATRQSRRMTVDDLDETTIELINQRYAVDFERLGYTRIRQPTNNNRTTEHERDHDALVKINADAGQVVHISRNGGV